MVEPKLLNILVIKSLWRGSEGARREEGREGQESKRFPPLLHTLDVLSRKHVLPASCELQHSSS